MTPREARTESHTVIRDLGTGQVIARTDRHFWEPWGLETWVSNTIADHFDAPRDECRLEYAGDEQFYSIDGKPVAYVEGYYEPLFNHLAEAAE